MKSKLGLYLFGLLFGGAFGAVGVGASVALYWDASLWFRSANWDVVRATVQSVELDEDEGTAHVECRYTYRYEGRNFNGERAGIYTMSDNVGSYHWDLHQRISAAKGVADGIDCYVNPDEPSQSMLDRTFRPGMMIFKLVFAVAFGSIGLPIATLVFLHRDPKEHASGKVTIDSENRTVRAICLVMVLFHSLLCLIVWPTSVMSLMSGQWTALFSAIAGCIPATVVYLCWRYRFKKHPSVGRLVLDNPCTENAILQLPSKFDGQVDLETRWRIPPPPSNKLGQEDEIGDSDFVQVSGVDTVGQHSEINVPVPQLPDRYHDGLVPPENIKFEVIGTVGSRPYEDSFEVPTKYLMDTAG